jgi:hypothetical protein
MRVLREHQRGGDGVDLVDGLGVIDDEQLAIAGQRARSFAFQACSPGSSRSSDTKV